MSDAPRPPPTPPHDSRREPTDVDMRAAMFVEAMSQNLSKLPANVSLAIAVRVLIKVATGQGFTREEFLSIVDQAWLAERAEGR